MAERNAAEGSAWRSAKCSCNRKLSEKVIESLKEISYVARGKQDWTQLREEDFTSLLE